jgi:hypothetical protein
MLFYFLYIVLTEDFSLNEVNFISINHLLPETNVFRACNLLIHKLPNVASKDAVPAGRGRKRT